MGGKRKQGNKRYEHDRTTFHLFLRDTFRQKVAGDDRKNGKMYGGILA